MMDAFEIFVRFYVIASLLTAFITLVSIEMDSEFKEHVQEESLTHNCLVLLGVALCWPYLVGAVIRKVSKW